MSAPPLPTRGPRRLRAVALTVASCILLGATSRGAPSPPAPGDRPAPSGEAAGRRTPTDSLTFAYVVGGVNVIQRLTPGNSVVAADLYLLGGVLELTESTAGIEELTLRAAEYGSARYPGLIARRAFAHTGSQWHARSETDWSTVGFVGLAEQFDSTWAVFADRVVHPTLDSSSIMLVRSRMTRELQRRTMSPEALVYAMADSLTFTGHPYGLHPSGTRVSLASLTPEAVREYARTQLVTSRMLLVVVGNVPRAHLEALVAATLGTLPTGSYKRALPPAVERRPTSLTVVSRPTATNYILGYYTGPSVASADYPAFEIATELLGARLHAAIRLRTSLSYAAYAPYENRAIATGGLYASTGLPSLVIALMRQQLDSAKTGRYAAWVLNDFEKDFRGGYLLRNETNEGQAGALARAEILFGDYGKAATELQRLREVSPGDVARIAKTYMRDIQFVYVGDTTRVRPEWVRSM